VGTGEGTFVPGGGAVAVGASVVAGIGPEGMSVDGPLFAVPGAAAEASMGWQTYIPPLGPKPMVGTG